MRLHAAALLSLLSVVSAGAVPPYLGFRQIWSDTFSGGAGAPPDNGRWMIATNINSNNEAQKYTTSNQNLQLSGGDTMQFVPRKSSSGQWTSGRIESRQAFTPARGRVTMMEARIRFGDNPQQNKQGIWPAFWMLGDSLRHGTGWPACGEIDIMERVNGLDTGYGTVHCGQFPGGACNEPTGRGGAVHIPDNNWHTWTVRIDRTAASGNWRDELIQWLYDGQVYNTLRGADIGVEGVWGTLAHSPVYLLLNLAVGGDWPGQPNGATLDGYGSMMEVDYVAVLESTR